MLKKYEKILSEKQKSLKELLDRAKHTKRPSFAYDNLQKSIASRRSNICYYRRRIEELKCKDGIEKIVLDKILLPDYKTSAEFMQGLKYFLGENLRHFKIDIVPQNKDK